MSELNVYRGKVVSVGGNYDQTTRVTFHRLPRIERSDIVLPEGVLESLERHTVEFGVHASRLAAAGRHLKRGILLHGPPGTGKTLSAMYLASRMAGHTVILITGRTFGLIPRACAMARSLQPSIVILEDVDLVAEERTLPGAQGCGPLLFELLNEMDGLAEDTDVVFLLTTNRPDLLEPALAARPGRIDQAIEIPLPDPDCRRRLLELYSLGLRLEAPDLGSFVERTDGVSAAFIRELLRKAALAAVREDGDGAEIVVREAHLDAALQQLTVDGGDLTKRLLGGAPPGWRKSGTAGFAPR